MKRIFFTVTNDLTYDQRMNRICTTLAENGYEVTLVGRRLPHSLPLRKEKYKQHRLRCVFNKGKLFYTEFNARLYIYLLNKKMDAICAIDLDTISPCLLISSLKKIPRIYDAHELFTEMKEVITRPPIKKFWSTIERKTVPKFQLGYTVSEGIAAEFKKRYQVNYETIRNMPVLKPLGEYERSGKFILYQGAVNEARGLEYLVPAMKECNYKLVICGDGNFMRQLKTMITKYKLEDKIELKGMLPPDQLFELSQQASIGVSVPEKQGLNQWLALPNKFFDYIHAGLPQITMDYPEYQKLNKQYEVAILLKDHDPSMIARAMNNLLSNDVLLNRMRQNCLEARKDLNWQREEMKLIRFYNAIPFRS